MQAAIRSVTTVAQLAASLFGRAHGDVTLQAVDVSTLKPLGEQELEENPCRSDPEATRIGTLAYAQTCVRCHGVSHRAPEQGKTGARSTAPRRYKDTHERLCAAASRFRPTTKSLISTTRPPKVMLCRVGRALGRGVDTNLRVGLGKSRSAEFRLRVFHFDATVSFCCAAIEVKRPKLMTVAKKCVACNLQMNIALSHCMNRTAIEPKNI